MLTIYKVVPVIGFFIFFEKTDIETYSIGNFVSTSKTVPDIWLFRVAFWFTWEKVVFVKKQITL